MGYAKKMKKVVATIPTAKDKIASIVNMVTAKQHTAEIVTMENAIFVDQKKLNNRAR